MDKNLVNIDDLVRQRLLGSEEKERAGAWARMSELLEEEMPRRRGAFVWRRTYSALGILLLVGAISLGGYELNKFRGLGNASDNTVAATAPVANGNNNTVAYNNTTANNTTANNEHNTIAENTINNNEPNNTNNKQANKLIAANEVGNKNINDQGKQIPNKTATSNGNNKTANSSVLASNTTVNSNNQKTQIPGNKTKSADHVIAGNDVASNNNPPAKKGNPAAYTDAVNEVNNDATTTGISNVVTKTETTSKPVAKATNTVARTEAGKNTPAGAGADNGIVTNKTANEVTTVKPERRRSAESENNTTSVVKKTATPERRKITESGNENPERRNSAKSGNNMAVVKKTENTERGKIAEHDNKLATKTEQDNSSESDKVVSNTTTKTTSTPKVEEKSIAHVGNKTVGKTPGITERKNGAKSGNDLEVLNSSAPASKPTVAKTNKVAAKETASAKPAKIAAVPGNTRVKPVVPVSGSAKTTTTATVAKVPGNTKPKPVAPVRSGAKTATTAASAASNTVVAAATNNKTGVPAGFKNKLPVLSKADKSDASEMKDVSLVNSRKHKRVIEKLVVMQRYLKTTNRDEGMKLDTISIESITEEYEVASAERAEAAKNGNTVAMSEDPDMDSSPIKPGASSESFSMSAKEATNKQPVGAKTLENLNAAFNDIKYNAGHATFAMGITGGINRTFFGPNNFMGFQFGISSQLSFGQSLSLMAELKYFNRINNNYSLNDDFYQYTAQPNGTFKREQVSNPYRIATLQSIELPIAVRYTTGRFNFAVGPNVVYTFNVNAGNYRTVDPNNTATYVSAMGNDNTAKLKADDFNSRFGLGYLFGVSYQVSPKVTIDLRDVQTIWDNAKTDGGKTVSTQLFRSPSFQLSLGYRFGGGNKEK